MTRRWRLVLCASGFGVAACNGARPGPPPAASEPPAASASAPVAPLDVAPEVSDPSGYLLVTKPRLAALHDKAKRGDRTWVTLKANVDEQLGRPPNDRTSVENFALVYLLTGDERYARVALEWARHVMKTSNVRDGSYLYFGDIMKPVALTLSWCAAALSAAEKKELADYLAKWTDELWHHNQGSGWGLGDPGNNYHMAFLEGTAFAGYALRQAGDPRGQAFVELVTDRLEKPDGVLAYLDDRARGGDWHEGANYGQRSKQRLFMTLSVIASMEGKNYFVGRPFFRDCILFAVHQLMPDLRHQVPSGDLARDVESPVSPYDRDVVQMATYWVDDAEARALGQWFLRHVMPSYEDKAFVWRGAYYKDVLFDLDLPERPASTLPRSYLSEGTGLVISRSGWDAGATALAVSAPRVIDQSHAHHDAGSFVLWRRGWLVVDAGSFSQSGLLWSPASHSGVSVRGEEQRDTRVGGVLHYEDQPALTYVAVDATGQFVRRAGDGNAAWLDEWTREIVFARPGTVFVYDRVNPKAGTTYDWRLHFASAPRAVDGAYSVRGGGGLTVTLVQGDAPRVESDRDVESRAQRLVATSSSGRLLAVLETSDGEPPRRTARAVRVGAGAAEGAATDTHVVLFSKRPRGAALPAKLTYEVAGVERRTHVLVNFAEGCDATVERTADKTRVTIQPGASHPVSKAGVIVFDG